MPASPPAANWRCCGLRPVTWNLPQRCPRIPACHYTLLASPCFLFQNVCCCRISSSSMGCAESGLCKCHWHLSLQGEESEEHRAAWDKIHSAHGILVPGGFGIRGVEGMVLAARYARTHDIPYLGICLGMQVSFPSIWFYRLLCVLLSSDTSIGPFVNTAHFGRGLLPLQDWEQALTGLLACRLRSLSLHGMCWT